jgi:hypothetical protein
MGSAAGNDRRRSHHSGERAANFELKIDDVEWTLWDIYKMVAAAELRTVEAAYLVVAGAPKQWSGKRDCVELFDLDYSHRGEQIDSVEWYSRFLFSHYERAWEELLGGGTGRLVDAKTLFTRLARAICRQNRVFAPDTLARRLRLCHRTDDAEKLRG